MPSSSQKDYSHIYNIIYLGHSFLYIDDTTILSLDSLQNITCQQGFPGHLSIDWSQGAVVEDSLMLCGGHDMVGCVTW